METFRLRGRVHHLHPNAAPLIDKAGIALDSLADGLGQGQFPEVPFGTARRRDPSRGAGQACGHLRAEPGLQSHQILTSPQLLAPLDHDEGRSQVGIHGLRAPVPGVHPLPCERGECPSQRLGEGDLFTYSLFLKPRHGATGEVGGRHERGADPLG